MLNIGRWLALRPLRRPRRRGAWVQSHLNSILDVEFGVPHPQSLAFCGAALPYMGIRHMETTVIDSELKKGTTPLLILALLEHEARHGYELSKLIESRSRGVVTIHAATLYPLLYRMEKQRWIRGRWVEKAGQRRRRYYQLTSEGKQVLARQRISWAEFAGAISAITGVEYA